jgi:hypothetical protein
VAARADDFQRALVAWLDVERMGRRRTRKKGATS